MLAFGQSGRETLRFEIQSSIAPLLQDGEVEDVLFADFVVR